MPNARFGKSVRGTSLIDVVVLLVIVSVIGALLLSSRPAWSNAERGVMRMKLGKFGEVGAMYRADNNGYLPIVMTYRRGFTQSATSGPLNGWCTWSAGGKNNNAWWTGAGAAFDVEAVDRPLTQYLYPGRFTAPPPPQTLPANSPERLKQADLWRDPADRWTHQRTWPNRLTTISSYDDVGTSYHTTASWFQQTSKLSSDFVTGFNIGAARFANGQGYIPSRMVWYTDQHTEMIASNVSTTLKLETMYGDMNKTPMLFLDGHVSYEEVIPGALKASYSNAKYSLIFDDLPNIGK
jgi:prepilin-type processing-associated H-X9-DG protein